MGREGTSQSGSHIISLQLSATSHLRSSSVLVKVTDLPVAAELKTADLTAMRHLELREEFSGLVARRLADITTCGDECCKTNGFWSGLRR